MQRRRSARRLAGSEGKGVSINTTSPDTKIGGYVYPGKSASVQSHSVGASCTDHTFRDSVALLQARVRRIPISIVTLTERLKGSVFSNFIVVVCGPSPSALCCTNHATSIGYLISCCGLTEWNNIPCLILVTFAHPVRLIYVFPESKDTVDIAVVEIENWVKT